MWPAKLPRGFPSLRPTSVDMYILRPGLLPSKQRSESVRRMAMKPAENRSGRNSRSGLRQYAEAVGGGAGLTAIAYLWPRYLVFSQIYLLGIVVLSLRVGRGPVLVAALLSAAAWDFFTIPPR